MFTPLNSIVGLDLFLLLVALHSGTGVTTVHENAVLTFCTLLCWRHSDKQICSCVCFYCSDYAMKILIVLDPFESAVGTPYIQHMNCISPTMWALFKASTLPLSQCLAVHTAVAVCTHAHAVETGRTSWPEGCCRYPLHTSSIVRTLRKASKAPLYHL